MKFEEYSNFWNGTNKENIRILMNREHCTDHTDTENGTGVGKDVDTADIANSDDGDDGGDGGDGGDCADREDRNDGEGDADCADDASDADYAKVVDTEKITNRRDFATTNTNWMVMTSS